MILGKMLPFLPAIYTEEACTQLGTAIAPVSAKYGWSAGGVFERFGPEIGLAIVAAPLAIETVKEFRAWRAEREKPADNPVVISSPDLGPVSLET
jgi:hypothetical protein